MGSTKTRSNAATNQQMTRFDMKNRAASWLHFAPDVKLTFNVIGKNGRYGFRLGGGQTTESFLSRNGAELALSLPKSIELQVYDAQGSQVESGTFFPPPPERRPASITNMVNAASAVPLTAGAFTVQIDFDGHDFLAGNRKLTPAMLAAEINTRLSELGPPPDPNVADDEKPPPEPVRLEGPNDPIVLVAPNAAVIPAGHTISPAQALADVAFDSDVRFTRDGAVLAVRPPAPDTTRFGQGWQEGHVWAVFPRASSRPPLDLPYNLAAAVTTAQETLGTELGWSLKAGNRPNLVPPPTHDVHYPVQSPKSAIKEWRQDVQATQDLAAVAREFLDSHGVSDDDALEAELDAADLAVRAVPLPPASETELATPQELAAAWSNLARFRRAAADLGSAVAAMVAPVIAKWQRLLDTLSGQRDATKARLLALGGDEEPELIAALARLDAAVKAFASPPPLLPATAQDLSAAGRALARTSSQLRDIYGAVEAALRLAIDRWDARMTAATGLATAARRMLPYAGPNREALETRLDSAEAELPGRPRPPRYDGEQREFGEALDAAVNALARVVAVKRATTAVFAAVAAGEGPQSLVAAAPHLERAARDMLPYAGAPQPELTARLDEAVRQLGEATPDWWRTRGGGLTTEADVDAALAGLEGDEAAGIETAARRFEDVVADVAAAANRTGQRLYGLRRLAWPYADNRTHRDLYLGLIGLNMVGDWPTLQVGRQPGARRRAGEMATATAWRARPEDPEVVAEMAAAAARRPAYEASAELGAAAPSVQRAEEAIGNAFASAIRELPTRRTAALRLAERVRELLPEVGQRREELRGELDRAYRSATARPVPAAALATLEELEATGRALAAASDGVTSLESAIAAILTVTIDEPVRQVVDAVTRVSAEALRLLPYAGEQRSDLEAKLQQARAGLPVPAALAPRPARLESVADVSSARVTLDRLWKSVPAFTEAVTAVIEAGWSQRVTDVADLARQLPELLRQAGERQAGVGQAGERQQALTRALDAAVARLAPASPVLTAEPEAAELDGVWQALASVTTAETAVGDILAAPSLRPSRGQAQRCRLPASSKTTWPRWRPCAAPRRWQRSRRPHRSRSRWPGRCWAGRGSLRTAPGSC